MIVDDKKAQRRPVTLGQTVRDQVVVERGLEGGETVISEGLQRVRPGQEVNAAPAGAPPPGTRPGGPPGAAPAGRPG
jgi:membrane fusion protein (multidrug efflux system)